MQSLKARLVTGFGAVVILLSGPTVALAQQGDPAQQVVQANFGNVISALNNLNVTLQNVDALNDLTIQDVQVVNVEDSLNGNNIQALNNALNRNEVNVLTVRNVLSDITIKNVDVEVTVQDVLQDFLNNNEVDIDDVIAIDILEDGTVVIFVLLDNIVVSPAPEG